MTVLLICGVVAASIVALVVGAVIFDLVGHLSTGLRASMAVLASGLVWGGVDRFHQAPVGLGDLLFLSGVLGVLVLAWWDRLAVHLDRLDGRADGRIGTFEKG